MQKLLIPILSLCFVLLFGSAISHAQTHCDQQLNDSDNNTVLFIQYLGQLFEMQVVSLSELQSMADGLKKQNKITNPVPHQFNADEVSFTKSEYRIHYKTVENYIHHEKTLDRQALLLWLEKKISELKQDKQRKDQAQEETKESFVKMRFNRVEKGEYSIKRPVLKDKSEPPIKVVLTHSLEMMSTLVTQKMWVDLMNELTRPLPHLIKDDILTVGAVKMQPDHPIYFVSWWSAAMFANKLSEKAGLKPAYDFSGVKFDPKTRAEDGSLRALSGKLKYNSPNNDIYETEGYRLPTFSEQEFVRLDRGRSTSFLLNGMTKENIDQYTWCVEKNSLRAHPVNTKVRAVATKPGTKVDNEIFYDLFGNIPEFSNDVKEDQYDGFIEAETSYYKGGVNPQSKIQSVRIDYTDEDSYWGDRLYFGHCVDLFDRLLAPPMATGENLVPADPIGFRLVRSVQ